MIYDFHTHSDNSFDSKEKINNMCNEALKKGITHIAFTEHFSLDENKKTFGHMNFNKYFKEIREAKEEFKELNIHNGLELCEPHLQMEELKETLKDLPIDFILGSIHNIKDRGLRTTAKEVGNKDCYDLYFDEYYDMVSLADFDIAAHLDLMSRYALNIVGNYNFEDYKEQIKKILSKIIEREKGIEINTSGLRNDLNSIHPKVEILTLYKELGGEIITIGSDGHKAEDVGEGCKEALKILKDLGYKNIYTFKNRKPIKHSL